MGEEAVDDEVGAAGVHAECTGVLDVVDVVARHGGVLSGGASGCQPSKGLEQDLPGSATRHCE